MAGSFNWVNQTTTSRMQTNLQLAWLAGLFDGEACIAFAKRSDYNPHRLLEVRYDVKLAMTCKDTIRLAYNIIVPIVGDDVVTRPYEEKRRTKRARPLWRIEVASKRGVHDLLTALLPYFVTKRLEAQLTLRYLERALASKHYRADEFDRRLAELATALRHGSGEARLEAKQLLEQVIPSQAVQRSAPAEDRTEGVEATTVSESNNPSQECPAPQPRNASAEGEEMVRSRGEIPGGEFNAHRLPDQN